ncbi:MAG: methionine--tRNA ligase [Bacteroidia bacterium]|nr:methionine--tRNA ligase [Bacteroidia bacterium]
MTNEFKRYTVTAALPYANGPVHIGHLAGCYLPADIYVRYLRATGKDVLFICGSDEHGVPITIKAKKEGKTPQEVVDHYHRLMGDAFKNFGIQFDYYGRTSSKTHHETAQDFFKTLYDKGVFKEEITQQYFDEKANQFLADRYITGTCPKCGNENAYGDQCEKCGSSLSPMDLINPRSALSGAAPVLKETKNWFLPMGDIQQSPEFKEYIKRFEHWKSNIKGQCGSWLNEGLQPRAMTRDLDWGVPVPLKGADGKVLYVWFDAPIGYISATKEYFNGSSEWEKYWKADDTALIHFIGKDNIVFHAIIFPMMLMQHGGYVLPANVPANEFLNLEGEKISTSRNWAVWLHEYLEDFPGRQDELRYVLTSIAPETKDSDFSWKDYQARVNNELVAILGNFVNRVMVLTWKFFDGKVPTDTTAREASPTTLEKTDALFSTFAIQQKEIEQKLSTFSFREALFDAIDLARNGNKYLQETEPWKLIKSDEASVRFILASSLEYCRLLASVLNPFLPATSASIFTQLNSKGEKLIQGHSLNEAFLLFKPIEDSEIEKQLAKLQASKVMNSTSTTTSNIEEAKPEITFEDFAKNDIRVGTILEAERVPKTDKLLKLKIDTGLDQLTVVSGIAEYHQPEDIIGKQVCILINLAPRKMKGIESQGMILMAKEPSGKLVFVSPSVITANGSGVA